MKLANQIQLITKNVWFDNWQVPQITRQIELMIK